MKGVIAYFRGSRRRLKENQMVVKIEGIDSKDKALKLVGKTVVWLTPAKKEKREIKGRISAPHGNKGAVRVVFEKGMPGQSAGQEVSIE